MTEPKRKRGRPPGSGKKKETTEIQNTDIILPDPIGQVTYTDGTSSEILQTKSDYQKGTLTMTLGPKKAAAERPYPSNWAEMGKVDKLKWLTANR